MSVFPDDNKYGQKLMEKMGWSKGSGLGRDEQGIKEHLTVKFKDDNKGNGWAFAWVNFYLSFCSWLKMQTSYDSTIPILLVMGVSALNLKTSL